MDKPPTDNLLPSNNRTVKRIIDIIARCSRPIYLPLIAAEAVIFAGNDEIYSYIHLVVPGIYLFVKEILKKNLDKEYIELSTLCNTASLAYSAYTVSDIYGGICAALNLAAFIGSEYNSVPYLLCIVAANLAAVQFFKAKFF